MEFPLAEVVWVALVFLLGVAVGSYLNVVVGRLPLEKSLLWPNSRCLSCLHPLALGDNLPVLGWLIRRGRCRYCGSRFSSRYLWVELATGLLFATLFYLEIMGNWHQMPFFKEWRSRLMQGQTPWQAWAFFFHHAILISLLLAAALCDLEHRAIPLSLTATGTVIGLIASALWAWPFPNDPGVLEAFRTKDGTFDPSWLINSGGKDLPRGLYPWPVWWPLPEWMFQHRWTIGLATGLAGAAAGMGIIRCVKFVFDKGLGKETLGLGDGDLMMMAGAFIGWQAVVVAFFVGAFLSLPVFVLMKLAKGRSEQPFGPGLAAGVVVTWMWWPWLVPALQPFLFEPMVMLFAIVMFAGGAFVGTIVLRILGFGGVAEKSA